MKHATEPDTNNISRPESQGNSGLKNPLEYIYALFLMGVVMIIFVLCRLYWKESIYTPEEGLGYYLGLVGGSIMLLAFIYALRKYIPYLRSTWTIQSWLSIHIIFGISGPLLVFVHSTFHINSINGGLALISTVLVFVSGLAGRFLYRKVNHSLRERKHYLQHLKQRIWLNEEQIKSRLPICAQSERKLHRYQKFVTTAHAGARRALMVLLVNMWRRNFLYSRLHREIKANVTALARRKKLNRKIARQLLKNYRTALRLYMMTLSKMTDLVVFERLFSMWRLFHIPLLALLFTSGVVHVIAVHFY